MQALEAIFKQFDVTTDDIDKAKAYQQKFGGSLERLLVNMGSISEDSLPEIYSQLFNAPILATEELEGWKLPEEASQLNQDFLMTRGWIPFKYQDITRYFATLSPLNWEVSQYLESIL